MRFRTARFQRFSFSPCLRLSRVIFSLEKGSLNMSISQLLLPEFNQEMVSTRKLLALVPDDKFAYQPHVKSMTLGRLAGHVAEMPEWGGSTLKVETLKLEPGQTGYQPASQKEMLEKFDKDLVETRALLESFPDEEWPKIWSLEFGGQSVFAMPRTAVWRGAVMNHLIHHRAQLGVYLRLLNIEIPGMYGPSADEMKGFMPKPPDLSA